MKEKLDTSIDLEHWKSFKKGDTQALALLYNKYSQKLYTYGRRFSQDPDFIKDCIQDLFVNLQQKKEKLANPPSVKNYLYKALRNIIFRALSQKSKSIALDSLPETYDFTVAFSHEHQLVTQQITQEQKEKLIHAFTQLTPRQKEAVFLRFYDNLSYEEIAGIMSINSIKATRNLVYRSLEALRKHLLDVNSLLLLAGLWMAN